MNDDPSSELTQAARLKRLKFRSGHRGTKELDLLFGAFAERHLQELTAAELDAYETLLGLPDPDVYDWIVGAADPPAGAVGEMIGRLKTFRFAETVGSH